MISDFVISPARDITTTGNLELTLTSKADIEKHLDTDLLVKCKEEAKHDFCRTKETILQIYDTLAETR